MVKFILIIREPGVYIISVKFANLKPQKGTLKLSDEKQRAKSNNLTFLIIRLLLNLLNDLGITRSLKWSCHEKSLFDFLPIIFLLSLVFAISLFHIIFCLLLPIR